MVASCALRRALVCPGPSPRRRGMVRRALQRAAAGGGQGANTCDRCATDVGSRRCTWIHIRAAPAGPARSCEGACAPSMRRCKASSSVRLRGPAGGSGQGHAATWAHRAHLLAPVDAAEDKVSHSPGSAGVWEVGGRQPRVEMAEPEVVPPLLEGVPDLRQAGADVAPVVPAERLPLDLPPRVVRENPVVVEGGDEVVPRRAGVPLGGGCHVHVALSEVGRLVRWGARTTP